MGSKKLAVDVEVVAREEEGRLLQVCLRLGWWCNSKESLLLVEEDCHRV
jgi:hypothetical protein